MRRIRQSQQSIEALLTSSRTPNSQASSSPCLACSRRAIPFPKVRHPSSRITAFFSTSTQRQQPIFKEKNPEKAKAFTDSVQAKLWGGKENVLGHEDPYDKNSPMRVPKAEPEDTVKKGEIVNMGEEAVDVEEYEQLEDWDAPPAKQYEEAKTWDGLERVGGKQWVEEYKDQERGRRHFTKAYLPSTKITDPEALDMALHRAVTEVFALEQAGLDLGLTSKGAAPQQRPDLIKGVKVGLSKDGSGALLEYPESADESALSQSLKALAESPQDLLVDTVSETLSNAAPTAEAEEEIFAPGTCSHLERWGDWGADWQSIVLSNPKIKFAVVKRVMQLTGHRLSDPIIQEINTVGQLLAKITAPPKPKKLIEAIQRDGKLQQTSNVKVSGRRVTSIDKEQEVGRWKVIEYALRERGLPIVGGQL